MKVALLLCGLIPNNFEKYYDSIYKTLIEPYNSDVFISTWTKDSSDDVLKLYKPKLCRIENLNDISIKMRLNDHLSFLKKINYKGNKIISLNGRYPMFYKMYDVNQLKIEYENFKSVKYDLIIRSRMDLDFNSKHPSCIRGPFIFNRISEEEIQDSLKNDILYLRIDSDKVWDQFAFGNEYNMNIYCNTFLNLEKLIQSFYQDSEAILTKHLENNKVNLKHTSTTYNIKIYG